MCLLNFVCDLHNFNSFSNKNYLILKLLAFNCKKIFGLGKVTVLVNSVFIISKRLSIKH